MKEDASSRHGQTAVLLVIEDDRSLREGLAMNLRIEGYTVLTARDGEEGMNLAFDARPDLVVLDIMLPLVSGWELLEELRRHDRHMPVLLLSARQTTSDKVRGLKLGADDYLSKPFDRAELFARIEALLRRRHEEATGAPVLTIGDVRIDRAGRKVQVADGMVPLTAREFDLLSLLAGSPGYAFTRASILERVWGWDYEGTERTVDNFVARIRRKVWPGGDSPIRTLPRVGYTFEVR